MSLEAAEAIVASEGVAALSVRRIAQSIGYTHGTLYLVFENLDGLLLELNRRTLDELTAALEQAWRDAEPGRNRLERLARAYLDFARAHPERFRLVFEHRSADGTPTPDWLESQVRRGYTLLENALEEAGAADAALTAASLWCAIHGATMLTLDDKLLDAHSQPLDPFRVLAAAVSAHGRAARDRNGPCQRSEHQRRTASAVRRCQSLWRWPLWRALVVGCLYRTTVDHAGTRRSPLPAGLLICA